MYKSQNITMTCVTQLSHVLHTVIVTVWRGIAKQLMLILKNIQNPIPKKSIF
jgi:hypothetical protein